MNAGEKDYYRLSLVDGSIQGHLLGAPDSRGVRAIVNDRIEGRLFVVSGDGRHLWAGADDGTPLTSLEVDAEGAKSLVLGGSGELYMGGTTYDLEKSISFVRKSSDHGVHWVTMDRMTNSSINRVHFVPGEKGGVYTVGSRLAANRDGIWTVRRSRDGGQTWQQVDSFTRPGKSTYANEIISDPDGRIYVGGTSTPDPIRWEVRRSDDGGDTWTLISPPGATARMNGELSAIAIDPMGSLFVAGTLDAWAVVQRSPLGEWSEVEFPFGVEPDWVSSGAFALAVDGAGNAFVAGRTRSRSPEGVRNSLVIQKLTAPPPPPRLTLERSENEVRVSWPVSNIGFDLESCARLAPAAHWIPELTVPEIVGDQNVVTLDIGAEPMFFRLTKP